MKTASGRGTRRLVKNSTAGFSPRARNRESTTSTKMFWTCKAATIKPIATSTPSAPKKPMENGEWFSSLASFCTTTGGTGFTGSSGVGVSSCFAPWRALPNIPLKARRNRCSKPRSPRGWKPPCDRGTAEPVLGTRLSGSPGAAGEVAADPGNPSDAWEGRSSSASGPETVTLPACDPSAAGTSPRQR